MKIKALAGAISFLIILYSYSWSELPPYVYKQWQDSAQEYLEITAVSVQQDTVILDIDGHGYISVEMVVKVNEVIRTKNSVQKGDLLTIKYDSQIISGIIAGTNIMWWIIGPGPVPILDENKEYPAFLNKEDTLDYFEPAAGGQSFNLIVITGIKNSVKIKPEKLHTNREILYNIRGQRIYGKKSDLHVKEFSPAHGVYLSERYKLIHFR